jgi:hypothetical protein
MSKVTGVSLHIPVPKVGAVMPGAPSGVLGRFVSDKLKNYLEPTRAGTPKGEAIGLSRKKFRAALLSLTSVDLLTQAKLIGVSYGVLRKWRTEEALLKEVRRLENEFLDGPYLCAAQVSMDMLLRPEMDVRTEENIDLEEVKDKRNLHGFEDAELYSVSLFMAIKKRFEQETRQAVDADEPSEQVVWRSLAWARPLGRLCRSVKGNVENFRLGHARYLSVILNRAAVWSRPGSQDFRLLAWVITALLYDACSD